MLRVPRLMRFVPRSVMTGFVNALAILIFLAQVPYIRDGGVLGVVMILAGLAIIYTVPRLTTAVPAPLVAIVVLTVVVVAGGPGSAERRRRGRVAELAAAARASRGVPFSSTPSGSSCRTRWRSPRSGCWSR